MQRILRTLGLTAVLLLALLAGEVSARQTFWAGMDRTPLRAWRSGEAAVLAELPRGVPVRLIKGAGAWLLVEEPGGMKAWAYQGHLSASQPEAEAEAGGADLFAPLPESIVLAEAADTSRSSRSVRPANGRDAEPLWAALETPLTRQDLEAFLREGGIGEFARVRPQNPGGPLRPPILRPAAPPGGDAERLLGLNLSVAAARRIAKPFFGTGLQRYVNLVGLSVARFAPGNGLAYRFVVLDSPAPLSFSLPGGFVLLTSGLVRTLENEAQLAALLAHEAARASLGHAWARALKTPFFQSGGAMTDEGARSPLFARMIDEVLDQALRQGLDQAQEQEADAAAIQMAYRAGYDPQQLASAIRAVERACGQAAAGEAPERSDLRPPVTRRLERIQALLAQLPMQDGLALGTGRFRANR